MWFTTILVLVFLTIDCSSKPSYDPLLYYGDTFNRHQIRVEPLKDEFLRYEVVEIRLFLPLTYLESAGRMKIQGRVTRNGEPVLNTLQSDKFKFRFSPREACFIGRWSPPWNPDIGEYTAVLEVEMLGEKNRYLIPFRIGARKPPDTINKPFCVVTLETDTRYSGLRFQHPNYRLGDWRGLVNWARFMGADAIMYLTGMTKAMYNPTPEKPFRQYNIDFALELGEEAHKQGLKFGAWIGAYLPYGKTQPYIGYNFARNLVNGEMYYTLNFSLLDKKRFDDIVKLVKFLDSRPEVDYIGLDYMRTGAGGYELVDEFVRDLYLDVPQDFWRRGKESRMYWLTAKIGVRENYWELWRWWRARKVALIFNSIKEQSGTTKPMWVFTLGWECGHQHGQDILMFNDAGADFVMLMLYEATRNEFDGMMVDLPPYFESGMANIIIGNSVDAHLLDNKYRPYQIEPEEWYRRTIEALDKIYDSKIMEGVFMHDLDRLLSGRGGDYAVMEYAVVVGSAFTELRERYGVLPVTIEAVGFDTGEGMNIKVNIKNISNKTIENAEIKLLLTPSITPLRASDCEITLKPDEERKVVLPFNITGDRYRAIVGVMMTWGDRAEERAFTFLPLQIKKPKKGD